MTLTKPARLILLLLLVALAGYLGLLPKTGPTPDTIEQPSGDAAGHAAANLSKTPPPAGSEPLQRGWSRTAPNINLTHIFFGELNQRGNPTGFHSRPGGIDPASARLKRLRSGPNRAGVYTAQVELRGRGNNRWAEKFSSFFPDRMTQTEVVAAVLHAYKNRDKGKNQPWEGPSGQGFRIQGYLTNRGGITTAFPVFTNN